jgi:hypothetical protein
VVPNYNTMGLAKASLEATVRYLASSVGPHGVRVNGISAGPIKTLAAAGISGFGKILKHVEENAPLRRNVSIDDVGNAAAFLLSELASGITGEITYVDAGFNTLARPVLYGSYHPMSLCPAKAGSAADLVAEAATEEVAVGGPLCESGDIFTQTDGGFVASRELPPAQVGDLLVIEIAGAYGFVMASNYNSKPLPAEVLIDGGKARLVRARQTPEDLVRGETV